MHSAQQIKHSMMADTSREFNANAIALLLSSDIAIAFYFTFALSGHDDFIIN
jgi:hypothetical protein